MSKLNNLISEQRNIHILTCASFSNCGSLGLATRHIHGRINRITDKAIQIENEKGTCWFPKRALVKAKQDEFGAISCQVAKWFNMDRWHFRMESEPNVLV